MKKIFLIVTIFICFKGFGQTGKYPGIQTLGSDSTLVESKGAFKSRLINRPFTDTAQANTQRIKWYEGAQIWTTGNKSFWIRDSLNNKWLLPLGSGGSGDTANLLIERGGSGVPSWWDNSDTLMLKDITGVNFINATTKTDSTLQIALDTSGLDFKAYIKYYSAGGIGGSEFSPGSAIYVGDNGYLAESPTVYFFDQTNTRLGLGTNAPDVRLHVSGAANTLAAFISTLGSDPGTGGFITVGNNDLATLALGDRMGGYLWRAMLGSSSFSNSASIEAYAEGTHSATSTPTKLKFMASPSGSLVRDTIVEFSSTGLVTFEKYTTAGSFTSADTTTYKPLGIDATGKIERMVYWPVGSGGSGETNTASNLGGGLANFSAKVGVDLQFNSFLASHFNLVGNVIESDTATLWPLLRATIPAGGGASDHGALTGLTDDDHTQYALLAGRSGGTTMAGGTGVNDDLIFKPTTAAGSSSANIYFRVGTDGATTTMTVVGDNTVGIGVAATAAKLHVSHTTNAVGRFVNTQTSSTTSGALLSLFENDGVSTDDTHRLGGLIIGGSIGSTETGGSGIIAYADGAYSSGSAPTQLQLEVAPTGSSTRVAALTIRQSARVGIGTTVPDARFDINLGTAEVFQLSYNDANGSAANKMTIALSSIGSPTFDATGTSPFFTIVDPLRVTGRVTANTYSHAGLPVQTTADTMITSIDGVFGVTEIPTISAYTGIDSLMSGQYTPTLANVANVASTTAVLVNYQKVGSMVHVQGVGSCTVTASGGTLTTMSITLPFASAMTLVTDCTGSGTARTSAAALPAYVATNTTTDVAEVSFYSGSGSHDVHFSFTYKVK